MKKKLLFLGTVVICLSILASGTIAYFTAEGTAHNVITTGGIDIAIIEKTESEDGTLVDFPEDGLSGIMPGYAVSKIVSVKNTGLNEAWIRVRVEQNILAEDGMELPLLVNETIPAMSFAIDDEKWMQKDGWYYYHAPVLPENVTDILFEEVRFAPEMGNEYAGCTTNISIFAQAVQTANNGGTVLEAVGWPTEVNE